MPTTYANSINSNPIFADRAEKDASGNVITTTYATKAEGLPAKSASDAGKVLTVNSAGSASWEASKTLTAGSGISITEGSDVVTIAASVLPSYNASDSAKVLSVNSAGTGVEWAAASGGDSDIFYADDTNTSFADIASAYNSGKYVVLIVNGKILCPLVQIYDNRSKGLASTAEFMQIDPEGDSSLTTRVHKLILPDGASQYWANTVYYGIKQPTASDVGKVLSYVSGSGMSWTQIPDELPSKNASDAGKALVVNSAGTGVEWASVGGGSSYTFSAPLYESDDSVSLAIGTAGLTVGVDPDSGSDVLMLNYDNNTIVDNDGTLEVANPVPANDGASDAGKVLTVATDGAGGYAPTWASAGGGTSYSAGNCISLASDTVSWVTSAGITNIISTAALPASPASDVLYLIPEA